MIEISNSQRDQAVRLLRYLSATKPANGQSMREANARRLAMLLANQLEKRVKK